MAQIPAIELALKTDPGRDPDKQVNEDSAVDAETKLGQLAVVCDGMGGHAGGKEASELAVKTILEIVSGAPEVAAPREVLKVAIEEANRRVWSMPSIEAGYRPGSTVVAILCHANGAEIAHVGDSRIYLVHAGAISQVTKDHSMVQEMVDRNLIRAEDAPNHPDANKIMRALGIAKDVEVDIRSEPIAFVAGDTFILCSDGLSDLVNAAEILDIAGSKPPQQAAGQLVDLANARGGHDNITAMLVRLKTTAAAGAAPTIVKTVQLTQHEAVAPTQAGTQVPEEKGSSGPRGTLLAEPGIPQAGGSGTALVPPMQQASISGPQIQIPSDIRRQMKGNSSNRALWITLIVLFLALALIGAGVVVYLMDKPKPHPNPGIFDGVDAAPQPAATQPQEMDASPPEIPPTPPLAPSVAPHASAGADVPVDVVCARARAAKANNDPKAPRLEQWCRAKGGSL